MKVVFLVLDGLADISHRELSWRTPLQAASTPALDLLAEEGCCALMYPVAPGVCPSSEVAHWSMFGYSPEEFPGRTYLHALAAGIPCEEGDALFMFNLVPVERRGNALYVRDASGLAVADFCAAWAERLRALAAPAVEIHYMGGIEFIVVVRGGSHRLLPTDPFLHHLPVAPLRAEWGWESDGAVSYTLQALNAFMVATEEALAREENGVRGEMGLIMKWPSRAARVEEFEDRHGMKAAAVVSTTCFEGMGKLLGMRVVCAGEEGAEGDLIAKLEAAEDLLAQGYEFVFVHSKHADEAAHTGDTGAKVGVIEGFDRALGSLPHLFDDPDLLAVITADHSTPTTRDPRVIHGGDPVPVLFHGVTVRRDGLCAFDEVSAASGGMGQIGGRDLMPLILYLSRRAPFFTGWT